MADEWLENAVAEELTHEQIQWLLDDLREERTDRDELRRDLRSLQHRYSNLLGKLGLPENPDERELTALRENIHAYVHSKQRQRGGNARLNEKYEVGSVQHLEGKLAEKRAEIRNLSKQTMELRRLIACLTNDEISREVVRAWLARGLTTEKYSEWVWLVQHEQED